MFNLLHRRIPHWFFRSIVCVMVLATSSPAMADTMGSYTFSFDGTAPENTVIRITAVGSTGTGENKATVPVSFTIDISGLNKVQATNNLSSQLRDRHFNLNPNGDNSLNVDYITVTIAPNIDIAVPINTIDGGSNTAGYNIHLDGSGVKFQRDINPDTKWEVSFGPGLDPSQGVTDPGDLIFVIPGLGPLSAQLASGASPADAARTFDELLVSNGFPDAEIDATGLGVSFLLSPSGQPITDVTDFAFTGANLDYQLTFPSTIPEPSYLPVFGLIILGTVVRKWHGGWLRSDKGES